MDGTDSIGDLPHKFRAAVEKHVETAFADPRSYFDRIAEKTPIKNFAKYLRAMIENNDWRLMIEDAYAVNRVTRVGFNWYHPECYSTTISVRPQPDNSLFGSLFNCADGIYWDAVGSAGGIFPVDGFHPLVDTCLESPDFPKESEAIVFGDDSGGDVFIYDRGGRAGMICHETGDSMLFPDVHSCCDWIFGQLVEGKPPEFQWNGPRSASDAEPPLFAPRLFDRRMKTNDRVNQINKMNQVSRRPEVIRGVTFIEHEC